MYAMDHDPAARKISYIDTGHESLRNLKEYLVQMCVICESSNIMNQLQCSVCFAQYLGLTSESLTKIINIYRPE